MFFFFRLHNMEILLYFKRQNGKSATQATICIDWCSFVVVSRVFVHRCSLRHRHPHCERQGSTHRKIRCGPQSIQSFLYPNLVRCAPPASTTPDAGFDQIIVNAYLYWRSQPCAGDAFTNTIDKLCLTQYSVCQIKLTCPIDHKESTHVWRMSNKLINVN